MTQLTSVTQLSPGCFCIAPTTVAMPFGKAVAVHAFGKPTNWRLPVSWGSDIPNIAVGLARFVHPHGVRTILSPRGDFSGRLCGRDELTDSLKVPVDRETVQILRGANADAIEVPKGEAYYGMSADCPTIVVYDPHEERLFCAHAGLDALWDRAHVLENAPVRRHESVVKSIRDEIAPASFENIRAYIACGISNLNFSHRTRENARMIEYLSKWRCIIGDPFDGQVSLKALIREQFLHYFEGCVDPDMIGGDCVDKYDDLSADQPGRDGDDECDYQWWSNRRTQGGKERNGILIIHRP